MTGESIVFPVAETFVSINGESRRAGELAVFVRFTGCNLRCSYCDTAWAIPKDAPHSVMTLEAIVDYVKTTGVRNVTITGGEPLLQKGLEELIIRLIESDRRVELETNGAVSIAPFVKLSDDCRLGDYLSITLDYKCPSSGMESYMLMDNYSLVRSCDTVKFVVGATRDMDRAVEIIENYQLLERGVAVYMGPVFGSIEPAQIVEYMKQHTLNDIRLQLQQHKIIWSPDTQGV